MQADIVSINRTYGKGDFIENVLGKSKNTYTSNVKSGDYWYEYIGK